MQTRRILLLFALVLGASALVASLSAPPATREDGESTVVQPVPSPARAVREVRFSARAGQTRRAKEGSRVTLVVAPEAPGEVELSALGLRQSADERTPARFELLAQATDVRFHELGGRSRLLGRLLVRPRARRG